MMGRIQTIKSQHANMFAFDFLGLSRKDVENVVSYVAQKNVCSVYGSQIL